MRKAIEITFKAAGFLVLLATTVFVANEVYKNLPFLAEQHAAAKSAARAHSVGEQARRDRIAHNRAVEEQRAKNRRDAEERLNNKPIVIINGDLNQDIDINIGRTR